MTFFDDYTAAIEAYPDTDVNLEIVNVSYPGKKLNVNEEGTFEIRITNTGPLRLNDVSLKVRGLNGVLVKHQGALSQLSSEMTIGSTHIDRVNAHGGTFLVGTGSDADWSQILTFKAPSSPSSRQELIEVSIEDWLPDVDHMHVSHSRGGAEATLMGRVLAA